MTKLVARTINTHAHTIRCARGRFASFLNTPQKSLAVPPHTNMAAPTRRLAASVSNSKVWYVHAEVRAQCDVLTSNVGFGGAPPSQLARCPTYKFSSLCRPGP